MLLTNGPPFTAGGDGETLPAFISVVQKELVGAPPWVRVGARHCQKRLEQDSGHSQKTEQDY